MKQIDRNTKRFINFYLTEKYIAVHETSERQLTNTVIDRLHLF